MKGRSFAISRDAANAVLCVAIRHLVSQGWDYPEIGRAIGYPSGAMVEKTLNVGALMGFPHAIALSRLASAHGCDVIADASSCDGKRTLPDPQDHLPNGDTWDEALDISKLNGLALEAAESGDWLKVHRYAMELFAPVFRLQVEAQLKLRPMVPSLAPGRGVLSRAASGHRSRKLRKSSR